MSDAKNDETTKPTKSEEVAETEETADGYGAYEAETFGPDGDNSKNAHKGQPR